MKTSKINLKHYQNLTKITQNIPQIKKIKNKSHQQKLTIITIIIRVVLHNQ